MTFAAQQGGGGGASTAETLQETYDASNPARIIVDGTNLGVEIRDNGTPIGASLFAVQNNTGLGFFAVSAVSIDASVPITNSVGVLNLGAAAVTNRGLGVGDVIVGGELEVDGLFWADAGLRTFQIQSPSNILDLNAVISFGGSGATDTLMDSRDAPFTAFVLGLGSDNGRVFLVTERANYARNHDHGVLTDPTLIVHSATDPDADNTQWLSFAHDQTNAVFNLGTGLFDFSGGEIGNVGNVDGRDVSADGATLDAHVADATIHFTQAAIDHTAILNIGTNSHATIDTHLASVANPHAVTQQQAYTATAGVPHVTLAAGQPFTIRDNVVPIGDVFVLENTSGTNFFDVDPASMTFGIATQRLFDAQNVISGYGGFEIYPDDFTRTSTTHPAAVFFWDSTLTTSVAGGGGIGNDTAPNFVQWNGEVIFADDGNLFNSQSLFTQGTTCTAQGANIGPIYTMINQPLLRTGSTGGSRTGAQQNAVRSQMRVGPNIAGNFTLTSHEPFFATVIVDATVGTAAITTVNYFAAKNPTLTAGGTIGTLNVLDIANIAGPTTIRGINSAMSNGTFIDHTGSAPSNMSGDLFMANGIRVVLGADGQNRVSMRRPSGGVMQIGGEGGSNNTVLEYDFDILNSVEITSTTGAGVNFNLPAITFGTTSADPDNLNSFVQFAGPNLRGPNVGGEYADVLWTASGTIDVGGFAISNLSAFKINSVATILSGGSIVNESTLHIAQMASANATNQMGLWVEGGRWRMDGIANHREDTSIAQLTADVAALALPANNNGRFIIMMDADASGPWTIQGIVNAQPGDSIYIINDGANAFDFGHEDGGAAAADRIITPTAATWTLGPREFAKFWYDPAATRWRILESNGA